MKKLIVAVVCLVSVMVGGVGLLATSAYAGGGTSVDNDSGGGGGAGICGLDPNAPGCRPETGESEANAMISRILNTLIGIAGVIAVGFIIYGGFLVTMSGGDAGKVARGKQTILYAVIGLIVAIMALAIVNFVINNVFNASEDDGTSLQERVLSVEPRGYTVE